MKTWTTIALALALTTAGACLDSSSGDVQPVTCSYDGGTYAVGASFDATDGCNTCSCDASGQVMCTAMGCPVTCAYDGQTHVVGDTFDATDGCNTCSCAADGTVACTKMACPVTCLYGGVTYQRGDTFDAADGCNTCSCGPSGHAECTQMACPATCVYGATTYQQGETFDAEDGCNTCSCGPDGTVACTTLSCEVLCTFEGQTYAVGEGFEDGCLSCVCDPSGDMLCTTSSSCVDTCVYGTTAYDIGQTWIDGCLECTCAAGGVTTCDDSTCPTECWEGNGECAPGLVCVTEPCEMCGPAPMGLCLPEPPQGLCWLDSHCPSSGDELVCVGSVMSDGTLGQCAPKPEPSWCWQDSHCPDQSVCVGAWLCPPDADCDGADVQGRCELAEGHQEVLLWTAKHYYLPGQTVHPVWFNFTSETIWLPGCTTYTIDEQLDGEWVDQGPPAVCGWEGYAVEVKPGDAHVAIVTYTPSGDGFHELRLRGSYSLGCQPDLPLSEASCTSSHQALRTFSVGPPPP